MEFLHGRIEGISRYSWHGLALSLHRAKYRVANTAAEVLVDGDTNRSYTFGQVKELSVQLGRGLRHVFKCNKGDVLGFFTPNHIDTVIVNLGVIWAGGVASPANPTYTAEELAHQLTDSNAKILVTHKAFVQTACKAAELANIPPDKIILLGDGKDEQGRFKHWTEVTADETWIKPKKPSIDPHKDLVYLVYSSVCGISTRWFPS